MHFSVSVVSYAIFYYRTKKYVMYCHCPVPPWCSWCVCCQTPETPGSADGLPPTCLCWACKQQWHARIAWAGSSGPPGCHRPPGSSGQFPVGRRHAPRSKSFWRKKMHVIVAQYTVAIQKGKKGKFSSEQKEFEGCNNVCVRKAIVIVARWCWVHESTFIFPLQRLISWR